MPRLRIRNPDGFATLRMGVATVVAGLIGIFTDWDSAGWRVFSAFLLALGLLLLGLAWRSRPRR